MSASKLFIVFAVAFISLEINAQNEMDALLFSSKSNFGSARYLGAGGAFGALGGDFGALSVNPAGIAIYRTGEFSFTPRLSFNNAFAQYAGSQSNASNAGLGIGSCGIVNVGKTNDPQVNRVSVAFGYNRMADFRQSTVISGMNNESSLADIFVNTANGNSYQDLSAKYRFGTGLAWVSYLIDTISNGSGNQYFSNMPSFLEKNQTKNIERTGSMGETFLAFGSSVSDDLYLGGSVGFPTVRMTETSVHTESLGDEATELRKFSYTENLSTSGTGLNLKVGGIYRVSDMFRVGAAYHTRDFYSLTLTYSTQVRTTFRDGDVITADSPTGISEYRLRTPQRFVVSGAFLMGKSGFVSADYEFVDYSSSRLKTRTGAGGGEVFATANERIDRIYRGTHNVRVGSEVKLNDFFLVRAGVNMSQNPFSTPADRAKSFDMGYSIGGGFRVSGLFMDLAYQFAQNASQHYLYDPGLVEAAQISRNISSIALTVGFKY